MIYISAKGEIESIGKAMKGKDFYYFLPIRLLVQNKEDDDPIIFYTNISGYALYKFTERGLIVGDYLAVDGLFYIVDTFDDETGESISAPYIEPYCFNFYYKPKIHISNTNAKKLQKSYKIRKAKIGKKKKIKGKTTKSDVIDVEDFFKERFQDVEFHRYEKEDFDEDKLTFRVSDDEDENNNDEDDFWI